MIRPTSDEIMSLAQVARQHVRAMEYIRKWMLHEVGSLPKQQQNVALCQGRCQVLQELVKLLDDAPSLAAGSQPTGT